MDSALLTVLITTAATSLTGTAALLIKSLFDDRKRRDERAWDLEDRRLAAERTAEHRELMAVELKANTVASVVAAEASQVAAAKADALQVSTNQIVRQTNGMQENLMKLASDAGFRKGADAEKAKHPGEA
jgi:hypothetical protein